MRHHNNALRDYRLAFALTLTEYRTAAGATFRELSEISRIPEQTLRAYEKGTHHPGLSRILALAPTLATQPAALLVAVADRVHRANGHLPDPSHQAVHALLLHGGLALHELGSFDA
ncbi:helix-turn-helix protein [Actinokineospora cianjurensis]|uniref:Helix-turn-helix protein n=2 Tax=Actinokineospora cianjurensis TaxID=585224 RepID=A0A421B2S5_9PSEU|nr:helix-turn-helix protein [Actinokineospora cianjurensis]